MAPVNCGENSYEESVYNSRSTVAVLSLVMTSVFSARTPSLLASSSSFVGALASSPCSRVGIPFLSLHADVNGEQRDGVEAVHGDALQRHKAEGDESSTSDVVGDAYGGIVELLERVLAAFGHDVVEVVRALGDAVAY